MKKIIVFLFLFLILSFSFSSENKPNHTTLSVIKTYKIIKESGTYLPKKTQAYFGDLHIHSGQSFDAYKGIDYTSQESTFRYAKGLEVTSGPNTFKIDRPLDFIALTDHAEYMGIWKFNEKYNLPLSYTYNRSSNKHGEFLGRIGPLNYLTQFVSMFFAILNPIIDNIIVRHNTWFNSVELADKYNEPGTFTTLPGFEWTDVFVRPLWADNNHRNVIFESSENLPYLAQGVFGTWSVIEQRKAIKLWNYMDRYRKYSGKDVLAIPHSMNISNGNFALIPFPFEKYLKRRLYNEPIMEITQIKGQSVTHPSLVSNDEYADYRIMDTLLAVPNFFDRAFIFERSYVRDFMKDGLKYSQYGKTNPFQAGFIGSTDTHENYSYVLNANDNPIDDVQIYNKGTACVWAKENTRKEIFAALRRKETYATDGSRMKIRLFAGHHYPDNIDFNDPNWVDIAYAGGVPMGSEINNYDGKQPKFLVWAIKDADLVNLDRIQIIKNTPFGDKVYNVALSSDSDGSVALHAVWQDPDFNSSHNASYFVRVIESPQANSGEQRRGWSSPVYYNAHKLHNPNEYKIASNFSLSYKVSPNPIESNSQQLMISADELNLSEKTLIKNIKVLDESGKIIFNKEYKSNLTNKVSVDFEGQILSGSYYVIINNEVGKKVLVK